MKPMPAINTVMTPMNIFAGIKAGLRRLALIFLLALPLAATAVEQRTFATPEAAVDTLLAALKARDEAVLTAIFGDKHKEMIASGDAAQNAADRAKAAEALTAFRVLDSRGEDRRVLLMGVNAWLWRQKHNLIHHTFTNLDGVDEDLATTSLLRMGPYQKKYKVHRYQAFYCIPVYGLTSLMWTFFFRF